MFHFGIALGISLFLFVQNLVAAELGVYIGNNALDYTKFKNWLGKDADGVLGYTKGPGWNDLDPGWLLSQDFLGSTRRKMFLSLSMAPDNASVAVYREIANGVHNAKYVSYAQKVLNYHNSIGYTGPIYVRSTWEVGGEWFPWTQIAKEDPTAFKNAWRQFARSFKGVSSRFKMVWDFCGDRPNVEQWYPGDDVIDVISQDIYWLPQYTSYDPVVAFNHVKTKWVRGLDWMKVFAAQRGKPMAISEFGAGGNNAGPYYQALKDWVSTNNVVYHTLWNSTIDYDSKLDINRWPNTETRFKQLYGPGGGVTTPVLRNVHLINSGSTANLTAADGRVFRSDAYFIGGNAVNRGALAIANTISDTLYQRERNCFTGYDLPVASGSYTVKLHFAENASPIRAAGQRVFDVSAEGKMLSNVDIFRETGGNNRALIKTISGVSVSDGKLSIRFTQRVGCALVNAIEVLN